MKKKKIKKKKVIRYAHIPVEFRHEIVIPLQFPLSKDELLHLESRIIRSNHKRRELIGKYYFILRKSMVEIAQILGMTQITVHRNIRLLRKGILSGIKRDLHSNKKLLEHMIDLMFQIDQQTRLTWEKYTALEEDTKKISELVDDMRANMSSLKGEKKFKISLRLGRLTNRLFSIHSQQQGYLKLLREQTEAMLKIWDRFGLTGEDAVKVIMSGGVDVNVKVKEVKTMVLKMVGIVKNEVKDLESRKKIFTRLANEINPSTILIEQNRSSILDEKDDKEEDDIKEEEKAFH